MFWEGRRLWGRGRGGLAGPLAALEVILALPACTSGAGAPCTACSCSLPGLEEAEDREKDGGSRRGSQECSPPGSAPTPSPALRTRGSQQGRAGGGGDGDSTEGAPGAGASFPSSPPCPSPAGPWGLPPPYLSPDGRHAAGGTSHRGEAGAGSGRGPLWPRRRPPRLRGPPAAESAAARPRRAEPGRAELYLTLLFLLGRAEAARKGLSGSPVELPEAGRNSSRGGCGGCSGHEGAAPILSTIPEQKLS